MASKRRIEDAAGRIRKVALTGDIERRSVDAVDAARIVLVEDVVNRGRRVDEAVARYRCDNTRHCGITLAGQAPRLPERRVSGRAVLRRIGVERRGIHAIAHDCEIFAIAAELQRSLGRRAVFAGDGRIGARRRLRKDQRAHVGRRRARAVGSKLEEGERRRLIVGVWAAGGALYAVPLHRHHKIAAREL